MTLQYDGSRYDGWLRGKDEGTNTIEFKIVEVLKKLTSQEIELVCGCRTEKGVHACAQVANFKLEKRIAPLEIRNYLNRYLPRDIAVYELVEVDERALSTVTAVALGAILSSLLLSSALISLLPSAHPNKVLSFSRNFIPNSSKPSFPTYLLFAII
jgi:hypothetical protein